jgi:hypothetical protein
MNENGSKTRRPQKQNSSLPARFALRVTGGLCLPCSNLYYHPFEQQNICFLLGEKYTLIFQERSAETERKDRQGEKRVSATLSNTATFWRTLRCFLGFSHNDNNNDMSYRFFTAYHMVVALFLWTAVLDKTIAPTMSFEFSSSHTTTSSKQRRPFRVVATLRLASGRLNASRLRSDGAYYPTNLSAANSDRDATSTVVRRQPTGRSAAFPPFVAETVEKSSGDDQDDNLVELTIRDDGRNVVSRAPPEKPWWFGISESFSLDYGPIQDLQKSKQDSRLRNDRSYARRGSFEGDRLRQPPGLYDLSTPPCPPKDAFWVSIPARFISYAIAYYCFPYLTQFVDMFVTMPPLQLEAITANFGPGISILYGTFISLTLSILYNRQRSIQETVSVECAYLAQLTKRIIALLQDHSVERTVQAGQAIADQIRALAQSSRGKELLVLMYTDPYARLGELVDEYEQRETSKTNGSGGRVAQCRDLLKDLYRTRAIRLSDESLALPPTHFFILNLSTMLMLLGFTVTILPTIDPATGTPSHEGRLLFALLSTIYLLFYNFANDLNEPFQGVYQIRRSTAAGHLLQMRWFLVNHPVLAGQVDFNEPEIDPNATGYRVATPHLGDFWFEEV